MKIFETFELFLRRPLSILRHGLVSLVHIKSQNMFDKKSINVDLLEQKAQITVVNNEKVYKLLKLTMQRAKAKSLQDLETSKKEPVLIQKVEEKVE